MSDIGGGGGDRWRDAPPPQPRQQHAEPTRQVKMRSWDERATAALRSLFASGNRNVSDSRRQQPPADRDPIGPQPIPGGDQRPWYRKKRWIAAMVIAAFVIFGGGDDTPDPAPVTADAQQDDAPEPEPVVDEPEPDPEPVNDAPADTDLDNEDLGVSDREMADMTMALMWAQQDPTEQGEVCDAWNLGDGELRSFLLDQFMSGATSSADPLAVPEPVFRDAAERHFDQSC